MAGGSASEYTVDAPYDVVAARLGPPGCPDVRGRRVGRRRARPQGKSRDRALVDVGLLPLRDLGAGPDEAVRESPGGRDLPSEAAEGRRPRRREGRGEGDRHAGRGRGGPRLEGPGALEGGEA